MKRIIVFSFVLASLGTLVLLSCKKSGIQSSNESSRLEAHDQINLASREFSENLVDSTVGNFHNFYANVYKDNMTQFVGINGSSALSRNEFENLLKISIYDDFENNSTKTVLTDFASDLMALRLSQENYNLEQYYINIVTNSPGFSSTFTTIAVNMISAGFIQGAENKVDSIAGQYKSIISLNSSNLSDMEKQILVAGLSTFESSCLYWNEKANSWGNTLNPAGPLNVYNADGLGGADLGGCVAGAMTGALTGGTVTLGTMTVPAALAGAVIGGLSGSVSHAVAAWYNSLW
jgi:hypothetical protein